MKVRAKKSLGQNFLRDESVINRIVDALDIAETDTVIEIGPGLGALTEKLFERSENIIAVEFDRDLIDGLTTRFSANSSFRLINEDALNIDFAEIAGGVGSAKLVANLPYNISTPILQKLIGQRELFSQLVLMFQREVVDRITAKTGTRDRGFLTVLTENAFAIERLFDVPPTAFQPVPNVWSSVVRLTPQKTLIENEKALRNILSIGFGQKRKTLLNNLKTVYPDAAAILKEAQISPDRRAETLELIEWAALVLAIAGER